MDDLRQPAAQMLLCVAEEEVILFGPQVAEDTETDLALGTWRADKRKFKVLWSKLEPTLTDAGLTSLWNHWETKGFGSPVQFKRHICSPQSSRSRSPASAAVPPGPSHLSGKASSCRRSVCLLWHNGLGASVLV